MTHRAKYRATQGKQIMPIISICFGVYSSLAFGGQGIAQNLNEAESKLSQAQNQYFDALFSGKGQTPEDARALKERTVGTAANRVNQLIQRDNDAYTNQHVRSLPNGQFNREFSAQERAEQNWTEKNKKVSGILEFVQIFFGGNGDRSLAGASAPSGNQPQRRAATAPEKTVNAKGVPKLLVFPGSKKKSTEEEEMLGKEK